MRLEPHPLQGETERTATVAIIVYVRDLWFYRKWGFR